MSVAADTREAVRSRPFLFDALRAGVVNYAAAARLLDVDADADAVATALGRFAEELSPPDPTDRAARVTMHGGLAPADPEGALLSVNGTGFRAGDGDLTGVLATGEVDARALERTLGLLRARGLSAEAAGVAGDALVVVVDRRDGARGLRLLEAALEGTER